jgi:putative ABC transport system permease protein
MNWLQDFRFAVRMIRKNPWFTAAIVGTLALGIGVNTTVFTLVNAVLYKPLPFPGGERLVMAFATQPSRGRDRIPVSYPDVRDMRAEAKSFEKLEAISTFPINVSERGNPPERYRGAYATAGLFHMLQVQPTIGRNFEPADERPGSASVMLIGYGMWKDRYGKDPGVVGRSVNVNEKPVTIIGVMPEGFKFPNNEDAWMPVIPDTAMEKRNNRRFNLIGLLKPDGSIAEATADLSVIARRLEQQYPDSHKDHAVTVQTFHQAMNGGQIRLVFMLMLGAVGFVLLIACANVANMLLSRAVARTREISIRSAMGASRWRIVRQLLIESVLLSMAGGLLGLFLAYWGAKGFDLAVANVGKPYWIDFRMDWLVFTYFAIVSIVAGIIFGIAPALQSSKVDLNTTLKESTRGAGGFRSGFLSASLVVFQFTLAMVLLSGAGLMMRSFAKAANETPDIPSTSILHAHLSLPGSRYKNNEDRYRFFEQLTPRLSAIPGVQMATIVSNAPGSGGFGWRFEIEGQPVEDKERRPAVTGVLTTSGYFRLINMPLIRGREFDETDGTTGKETVIVNQQFVSRFWANQDPIGKRLRVFDNEAKPKQWMTVVGVAPTFRQSNPNEASDPVIFVPYHGQTFSDTAILLRTSVPPASLASALRLQVQSLDSELPLFDVVPLVDHMARRYWHLRVFGTLFMIFAVIALGMAAVGIYAVMSHATQRRTQEIGIRLALGAEVPNILRLVIGRGLRQLVIGMVLGLAAAMGVTQLMSQILFRVSPRDPLTLTVVTVTLATAGLLACWLPARRAAALDPVKALRYE